MGPLISICIPHRNRLEYLLRVLESVGRQTYARLEIVVSDNASTDGSEQKIPEVLRAMSRYAVRYIRQARNVGYDANLRAVLSAASGDYLFCLGNDDVFASDGIIEEVVAQIERCEYPDVCVGNYAVWPGAAEQATVRLNHRTQVVIGNPDVAIRTYRVFSLMSGIVLRREAFVPWATEAVDGSLFAQVFIAASIIASGGRLLQLDTTVVLRDVQIDRVAAPSSFSKEDLLGGYSGVSAASTSPDGAGIVSIARVAAEAILPHVSTHGRRNALVSIYWPVLMYTYPYRVCVERERGSWRSAIRTAKRCFPPSLLPAGAHGAAFRLLPVYVFTTAAAFTMPRFAFRWAEGLAKRANAKAINGA